MKAKIIVPAGYIATKVVINIKNRVFSYWH